MRTLRMLTVGTVTLALLGGLGGAVGAQSEEAAQADGDYVTGTMTFVEDLVVPGVTRLERVIENRDASAVYDLQMSDERVAGTLTTLDYALDAYPGTRLVLGGPGELVTPDGTWTGTSTGAFHPAMGWQLLWEFHGQGELEGLTFVLHGASPELDDGVWEMDGFIAGDEVFPAQ